MKLRFIPDLQTHLDDFFDLAWADAEESVSLFTASDIRIPFPNSLPEVWSTSAVASPDVVSIDGQADLGGGVAVPSASSDDVGYLTASGVPDDTPPECTSGVATGTPLASSTMPGYAFVAPMKPLLADSTAGFIDDATATPTHIDDPMIFVGLNAAAPTHSGGAAAVPIVDLAASAATASLAGTVHGHSGVITEAGVGAGGATAAQVQQALDESGLSVNGTGIKVGVLSDSFNNLGGAAADEAGGALPSASNVQVIKDLASGGTDEGRAMMQIIHDIAPGANLAFYTAFDSEQDFANGILALAAAGSKVIVDDVSYFDEPFFQNGVVAQAIQTVEAEGVTYVTAAGNDASNGYQAAWSPISGTFDGHALSDAESFGGSLVQTVTINTEGTGDAIPLLLEWNQAYGAATSNLEILVFHNGSLVGTATNQTSGEPTNPWVEYDFATSGTYQVAIENLSGPNPGQIKEITAGDGLPATISGANSGTVVGHAMTPGAISAGAVSVAQTPAFGFSPAISESFSSSGAGTELLFANNGTALSSPDVLSPVTVSGVDDIATTITGGLSDFYGTSAASASLAGVAALILSADPNLTPAQVEQIMEQTAAPMSNSAVSGAGLAQVDPAVAAAEALATTVVIRTDGSTTLLQIGANYYADTAGSGHELRYGGAPVTVGEFGSVAPIGAVQSASGYDIAWQIPGTNEFTFWTTDSNGNYISNINGLVPGNSFAVESLETTFGQDFNGDGTTGVTASLIKTDGSTNLLQIANNYYAYVGGMGPELKYGGAAVTVGEFGIIAPVGAVQTSSGFDIAWQIPGTNQFTFWATDSNGNYTSNITGLVPGNSFAVESLETTFGQDLNGDSTIGVTASLIKTDVSTSLLQIANNYYIYVGGVGPELKYGGSAVTVDEFGSIAPIGAVQTTGGYEIAWQIPGTNEFTFWTTDSNGNYTSNVTSGLVAGTDPALFSFETLFHQDFNSNGAIGSSAILNVFNAAAVSSSTPEMFTGSTLTLEASPAFDQIVGFAGDGTLQGSDQVDLRGISFNSIRSAYDSSTGVLDVNDGTNTTDIHFAGNYAQDSFKFANDGHGGSIIYAQTGASQLSLSSGNAAPLQLVGNTSAAGQDTFVFASNFGRVTISNFAPATDTIEISKTVFANIDPFLAATHHDAHGNAVITDAAHDTITIQNVTKAQLLAHQSDFHIV
jgi:Tryptophan-rich Synechocystis species C-terminal domain/Subtilase family